MCSLGPYNVRYVCVTDRYDAYVQNYGHGADYGCCADGPLGLPCTVNRKLKQALKVKTRIVQVWHKLM